MRTRDGGPKLTFRERVDSIAGGATLIPLIILFGLNAVDELDTAAFSVLTPEIRDAFGLSRGGILALPAFVLPLAFIVGVPIARLADKRRRVPLVSTGAVVWGLFSIFTGMAPTVLLLVLARMGAGVGRAVNGPVHASLLSDYYAPTTRAKVFATHRAANTVGAMFGPVSAGFLAEAFGWRVPFFVLAVPTFLFLFWALSRLNEPERTGHRLVEGEIAFRQAFSILWSVGTLRRIWLAFPFIAFFSIGLGQVMSLYYADVFDASVGTRGVIGSLDSPFILLGLIVGAPLIDRGMKKDPSRVMRGIGLSVAAIAVFIIGIAVAPNLWVAAGFQWAISILGTVLYAGGFALVSLVAPPEARASAFAFFNVSSLLGILAFPFVGILSDAIGGDSGLRWALASLTPMVFIGCAFVTSAARYINADIERIAGHRGAEATLPPTGLGPLE